MTPCLFKEHSTLLAMLGVEPLQTSKAASRKAEHTRWRIGCRSFGHAILHVQEEVGRAARPAEASPGENLLVPDFKYLSLHHLTYSLFANAILLRGLSLTLACAYWEPRSSKT